MKRISVEFFNENIFFSIYIAVKTVKNGNVMEISAEYKPSPRQSNLLEEVKNPPTKKFCPKCTLGLDIKHTDVLILSQYCRSDGTMLPRRITNLCAVQQKNIGTMVLMARNAGKSFRTERTNAHNCCV